MLLSSLKKSERLKGPSGSIAICHIGAKIAMSFQDWAPVVLDKRGKRFGESKADATSRALRAGGSVASERKCEFENSGLFESRA